MNKMLAAFAAGLVFGAGLIVAQMTNPGKVIGFLNVTGHWDPSLILVMAGGLVAFGVAYRFSKELPSPYLSPEFVRPKEKVITRNLILGSAQGPLWAVQPLGKCAHGYSFWPWAREFCFIGS